MPNKPKETTTVHYTVLKTARVPKQPVVIEQDGWITLNRGQSRKPLEVWWGDLVTEGCPKFAMMKARRKKKS